MGRRTASLIEPLEGRARYLRERIDGGTLSPGALGWNTAELYALDYAIEVMRDMIERDSDEAIDVPRRRELNAYQLAAARAVMFLADHDEAAAERIIQHAPEGLAGAVARQREQRRYGVTVPRADDTRRRTYQ